MFDKKQLAEDVARYLHMDWFQAKKDQGVTSRPSPAGHEQMAVWEDLHPDIRADNVRQATTAIDAILSLGFTIVADTSRNS